LVDCIDGMILITPLAFECMLTDTFQLYGVYQNTCPNELPCEEQYYALQNVFDSNTFYIAALAIISMLFMIVPDIPLMHYLVKMSYCVGLYMLLLASDSGYCFHFAFRMLEYASLHTAATKIFKQKIKPIMQTAPGMALWVWYCYLIADLYNTNIICIYCIFAGVSLVLTIINTIDFWN
jgi:hypothetical protein